MTAVNPPVSADSPTFLERWVTNPRALLGYSTLFGAATGAWFSLRWALTGRAMSTVAGIVTIFGGLVYFGAAGYTAVQLLRNEARGDRWAVAVLVPQLVQIQSASFVYKVICGLNITITVGFGQINFSFGAYAAFGIATGNLGLPTVFAVNLVPAGFLWYLYHVIRRSRLTSACS